MKSRMMREYQVRFCERFGGVTPPYLLESRSLQVCLHYQIIEILDFSHFLFQHQHHHYMGLLKGLYSAEYWSAFYYQRKLVVCLLDKVVRSLLIEVPPK